MSRPEGSSGSSIVSDLARGIAHMDTCTLYIFQTMLARSCKFVLPKLQTIYNIHQYTSIYNHSFGILQIVSHDFTLSSPSLGGAARDFQVTTGTRIVEASTADGVSYTSLLGTDPKWVS